MTQEVSYPLRFVPILQYRLWGGQRLPELLGVPLPNNGAFGEAWLLSDRDDHGSVVANGALRGQALPQIMSRHRAEVMGRVAQRFARFPLLLKFLDARQMLSVQVHPAYTDNGCRPTAPQAQTEAWVVLETSPNSRIYAGQKAGCTIEALRLAVVDGSLPTLLNLTSSKVGDAVLSRREQFTPLAIMWFYLRFSKTATPRSAFTTGTMSTATRVGLVRCRQIRHSHALTSQAQEQGSSNPSLISRHPRSRRYSSTVNFSG